MRRFEARIVSEDDIPYELAYDAHRATSMVPEQRAQEVRQEYVAHIKAVEAELSRYANTPEKKAVLAEAMERYRQKYLGHMRGVLQAKSRTMSSMITGPSRFPTARNQKALDAEQKRVEAMLAWQKKAQNAIRNELAPRAISGDRADAIEALTAKITEAEELQRRMVGANKVVRKAGLTDEQKVAALIKAGIPEKAARQALQPDYMGRSGFPSYALTNNTANIRRMRERIAQLTASRAQTGAEATFEGGRVVDSAEDNRVQIFFDAKPPAQRRRGLQARGFKWAPTVGAWQRQRNNAARTAASEITGARWPEGGSDATKDKQA